MSESKARDILEKLKHYDNVNEPDSTICYCPKCDIEIPCIKGTPCQKTHCPECGEATVSLD